MVLVMWAAAVLERGVAPHLAILGVTPDFLLLVTTVSGLMMSRPAGAVTGFAAGLIQGALIGANLSHYVVSRALAGFFAAWIRQLRFDNNAIVIALTTAALTVFAEIAFMLTAGPKGIAGFLGDTMGTAIYNGVLAIPVYALLKRVLNPVVR